MSKHDAAPTHTWVITSYINRWIVRLCLLLTACVVVAGATVYMKLRDDCTNATNWRLTIASYVIEVGISSDPTTCLLASPTDSPAR